MRPIELRIKGINSFEEEQVVDFEKLTRQGLFGIFGPTGSGKSTILDAMTLALYGELVRDTKDFVNLNEETGAVSFTFSIQEKEVCTYRVSRTFRRNKGNGYANTKSARLVQLYMGKEEGAEQITEEVMEDSIRGVKEAINRLIGLEFSDFSRTVVLPQGKFSEFLQLSGAKRNDMLERLFHLQPYGMELMNRIRRNRSDTQNGLSEKEGQLLTYEEVTKEALAAAKSEEKHYKQELKAAEKAYKACKKTHAKTEADYARTKELEKEEKRLEQLLLKEPDINGYRKRLEEGQKAEKVLPYVKEETRAKEAQKEQEEKTGQLQREMSDTGQQLEALQLKEQAVREEERERIPALTLEQKRLSDLEEEITKRVLPNLSAYLKMEGQAEEAQGKKEKLEQKHQKEEQACAALEQEIETIKTEKQQLVIPREYRMSFQQAADRIKEYEEAGKQKKQQETRLKKQKKTVQNEKENYRRFLEEYERWDADRAQEKEEEKQALSRYIRTLIRPGEPCPVCGNRDCMLEDKTELKKGISGSGTLEQNVLEQKSLDEPVEVDWRAQEKTAQQKEREYLEEKVRLETKLVQRKEQLCQQEEEWKEACQKEEACRDAVEKALTKVNATGERCQCQTAPVTIDGYEEENQRLKQMEDRLEQLEEQLSGKEQQLKKRRNMLWKLAEEYDRAKELAGESMGKCQALEQALKQDYDRLLAVMGDSIRPYEGNWEAYQEYLSGYSTKEEQAHVLKEIKRIQTESGAIGKELEQVRQKENEVKEACAAAAGKLESLKKEYERCRKQCEEALSSAGYESAEQVWEQTISSKEQTRYEKEILEFETKKATLSGAIASGAKALQGRRVTKAEWEESERIFQETDQKVKELNAGIQVCSGKIDRLKEQLEEKKQLMEQRQVLEHRMAVLSELEGLVKGKKFVEYAAREKLQYVAKEASRQLKEITSNAYGLELHESGEFYIRDYKNGGILRSSSSLSGGELFLASLSLALALSTQIQLKGTAPLEFFFLDEGFGTLDEPLLEVVMDSLEKLQNDRRKVGIISHVEALKNRIPMKLMVTPSKAGKGGSQIRYEWNG